MIFYRKKAIYIILLVDVILFCTIYYLFISEWDRTRINIVGIVGSILSLSGIILTFLQIKSVEEVSNSTKEEVEKSLQQANERLTASDLTRADLYIKEIQNHLINNSYKLACSRMNDLQRYLIEFKSNKEIGKYEEDESVFQMYISSLSADIKSINTNKNKISDKSKSNMIKHLQDISVSINGINGELKNKLYDR
ncbi:hypothetical protein [Viscerimonas tarda]